MKYFSHLNFLFTRVVSAALRKSLNLLTYTKLLQNERMTECDVDRYADLTGIKKSQPFFYYLPGLYLFTNNVLKPIVNWHAAAQW